MRTVRGTIDYQPQKLNRINYISNIIKKCSIQLGAQEIDTPIMELTNLLLNKYGDEAETKLIYKLKDEKISLRYDLTVPFTRYIMSNGIDNFKRIQIGKVFRRDLPYPQSGRYCEFMQGDFDIIGEYSNMIAEAEIMKLITMVLDKLQITNYIIKINFRKNLELITTLSNINNSLFKTVCTSIDKLDKCDWEYISNELLQKNITQNNIDSLNTYLINNYMDDSIKDEYNLLLQYCEIWNCNSKIKFDATLARGLDYYTGLIYEVVLLDQKIGSIIAGGRYDKMIYKIKKGNKIYTPAIGVSFGINRIEMSMNNIVELNNFKILVVSEQKYMLEKLKIVNILIENGWQIEYFDNKKKNVNQINYGIKNNFNYIIIYGENDNNIIVKKNDQSKDIICSIDEIIDLIN